jgi:2-C-methyl-D-erythritol 2,4-cyclodiphosphate synthase
MSYRIGFGIDFHQLVKGREFWIGGVKIDYHKGAIGHSDADVLLHAICDALLGAAALGDIGEHFPDTDTAYKNIDSKILLTKTIDRIKEKNYQIENIDSTVCLQEPRIKPYTEQMRRVIADLTGISEHQISVKATTTEKMGFIGKGKGIAAYATVLLKKNE